MGVAADGGEEVGVLLGQSQGLEAGVKVGTYDDHGGQTGLARAVDDAPAVVFELGELKVTVGVDEHDHSPRRASSSSTTLGSSFLNRALGCIMA